MKIGILTYHRSLNYGAELQAIALMNYIKKLGYDVTIIDYWPDYRTDRWGKIKSLPFCKALREVELMLMTCIRTYIRKRNTEKFIKNYMDLSDFSERFDVVIYGSDQIWRKFNTANFRGYDKVYWGEGIIPAKHRITYAASMGKISVKDDKDKSFIMEHFHNFQAISLREEDFIDYCKATFDKVFTKVLDPVFLLSEKEWKELVPDKNVPQFKYILYYTIINNKETQRIVDVLQKQTGLRVIEMRMTIPEFHYGCRYRYSADAQEFISILRNAEYVVASSFHGVALSLKFNKQFYYAGSKTSSNRIYSLLNSLELSHRIINKGDVINRHDQIDYIKTKQKLSLIEKESREWLFSILNSYEEKY